MRRVSDKEGHEHYEAHLGPATTRPGSGHPTTRLSSRESNIILNCITSIVSNVFMILDYIQLCCIILNYVY